MFSQTLASPAAFQLGFTPPAALGFADEARPPAPGYAAPGYAAPGHAAPASRPGARHSLRARLGVFRDRWIARNELARMDGRMLRDIALTPAEARREAAKPFWRA